MAIVGYLISTNSNAKLQFIETTNKSWCVHNMIELPVKW